MYSLAPEAEAKCQRLHQPFPTPWGTTPQKNQKMEPDNTPCFGKGGKHLQTTIFFKKGSICSIFVLGGVYQNRNVLS